VRFGTLDIGDAQGAVLAHTVHLASGVLKKGHVLTAADIEAIRGQGLGRVMAARLDADDVAENDAAARIAAACCGTGLEAGPAFTGRVNLLARAAGVAVIDRDLLIQLNSLDEGLTVATVQPFETVKAGQLVATIKIIPFALPARVIAAGESLLRTHAAVVRVAPFASKQASLLLTRVAGMQEKLLEKRRRVMADRLTALGSTLAQSETVTHDTAAVCAALRGHAEAGHDPILVFGGSAIVDRGDVIPQAIVDAGGTVIHVGMPVDPGNLALVGRLGSADVIGVPSCASSPKLNGFDWILSRLLAGLPVGWAQIVAMAPGGLLTEIPTRPQPRRGS
jgi:molybdenum cofactor cytidylyltransferase